MLDLTAFDPPRYMGYSLEAWLVRGSFVYSVAPMSISCSAYRLGPIILGSHLNALLLGFVIIQVYQYFTASHKYVPVSVGLLHTPNVSGTRDRIWVKLLVSGLQSSYMCNFS